jgi:hypothetical protein
MPVAVRPVLAPPGNPHDNQAGVAPVQDFRAETHRFERPGAEILDQHLRSRDQVEEQLAPVCFAQAQRHALLVSRIDLPMHADAVGLPGAQRVAAFRVLDLQHLRAEIGELETDHVAGNEPRHVDHAHAVERTRRSRFKGFLGHTHRSGPIPQTSERVPP